MLLGSLWWCFVLFKALLGSTWVFVLRQQKPKRVRGKKGKDGATSAPATQSSAPAMQSTVPAIEYIAPALTRSTTKAAAEASDSSEVFLLVLVLAAHPWHPLWSNQWPLRVRLLFRHSERGRWLCQMQVLPLQVQFRYLLLLRMWIWRTSSRSIRWTTSTILSTFAFRSF